jgi:hypothetical protein
MALSFDVNINIGSELGFTIQTGTNLIAYTPQIQTVLNLNGDRFPIADYSQLVGPLIQASSLTDFVFPLYTISNSQTVTISNIGLSALTITNILYSISQDISPVFWITPPTPTNPIVIAPGASSTIGIAYVSFSTGIFDNYIIFKSNNATGSYYKIETHQLVGVSSGFTISPSGFSTTTTLINHVDTVSYSVTAIVNTAPYPGYIIPLETSLSGSRAWKIIRNSSNVVSLQFDPSEVNNVNGTYISTLTVTSSGLSRTVINTATININYDTNKHIAGWISPASHYNSIIGISYDLENDQRILTIGVGMGGDGVPIYGAGGSKYANLDYLGLGANSVTTPYPFWAKVYKIPFTGSAQVYYSNDYVVKTTSGLDYSSYFGEYRAPGSMFIVEDDGYGSIKIEINHLRDLIGDEDETLSTTLKNLTRAFYYYSNVDILGRYTPLPTEYIAPNASNTATTSLFLGFDYNTRDKSASVNTSIVVLPI